VVEVAVLTTPDRDGSLFKHIAEYLWYVGKLAGIGEHIAQHHNSRVTNDGRFVLVSFNKRLSECHPVVVVQATFYHCATNKIAVGQQS
jgi:hypothetical protein